MDELADLYEYDAPRTSHASCSQLSGVFCFRLDCRHSIVGVANTRPPKAATGRGNDEHATWRYNRMWLTHGYGRASRHEAADPCSGQNLPLSGQVRISLSRDG